MKLSYTEALAVEESLPPGQYEIRCFLEEPLSHAELGDLEERMIDAGVLLTAITQRGSVLSVKAVKPGSIESGIAVIPIFVAAIAILGTVVIGLYSIFALSRILDAMVPLAVVLMGGYAIIKTVPAIVGRRQ